MKDIAVRPFRSLLLAGLGLLLVGGCQTTGSRTGKKGGRGGKAEEPSRPDARALAKKTIVKARRARLALSDRWRKQARLTGAHVSPGGGAEQEAEGNVVFELSGLRLEIAGTLAIKWIPDHDEVLLYASDVALFHQERDRPYHSENLSAVTMANDQVSFFQQ